MLRPIVVTVTALILPPVASTWQLSFGADVHWPGYASPVVSGGRVFQHARQGDDEVVRCLDLGSGAVKWRQNYAAAFTMGKGGERHGKGPKSSTAIVSSSTSAQTVRAP